MGKIAVTPVNQRDAQRTVGGEGGLIRGQPGGVQALYGKIRKQRVDAGMTHADFTQIKRAAGGHHQWERFVLIVIQGEADFIIREQQARHLERTVLPGEPFAVHGGAPRRPDLHQHALKRITGAHVHHTAGHAVHRFVPRRDGHFTQIIDEAGLHRTGSGQWQVAIHADFQTHVTARQPCNLEATVLVGQAFFLIAVAFHQHPGAFDAAPGDGVHHRAGKAAGLFAAGGAFLDEARRKSDVGAR